MKTSEALNNAADVLEKVAAYIEKAESGRIQEEADMRQKQASDLAEKLSEAIGEDISVEMAEKLSSIDNVPELLGRLTAGDTVDSLGGPETEKLAGVEGAESSADAKFLEWVLS